MSARGDGAKGLTATGVSVEFGGIRALNGVDANIERGTCMGLIGPNGAGKTTFLDVLSGLRRVSHGRIEMAGADITGASPTARARLGMRRTFQRPQCFGGLTVRQNVEVGLEARGQMRRLARDLLIPAGHASARLNRQHDRVAEVIDRCGLGGVADELAGALPIGKLRLLELARAMVASPAVLLLDEPTSGLGDEERQNFGELVRELLRDARPAVLLVEHDVDFVMALVDRILVLETGRVLAVGDAAEVMKDPAVLSAYIGRSEDDGARVGRSLA